MEIKLNNLIEEASELLLNGKFIEFDNKLSLISDLNDYRSIRGFALLLDDNFKHDEILFSIIHTIEQFDDNIYTKELIKILPELYSNSPKWAKILTSRIKNNPTTFRLFLENLKRFNPQNRIKFNEIIGHQ